MKNIYAIICHKMRLLIVMFGLVFFSARGETVHEDGVGYRIIELRTDTLPNLNIARSGHKTVCIDGEIIVFGGHTNGFIPTATAEYFSDGEWNTVPLVYPHDGGTVLELRSGKVFLAGGHKEPLGIGHLHSAELFDPKTHTSQGFGCMDTKRAFANATEMADGEVVVSGNWYNDDGIEKFINVYQPMYPNAVKVKDTSYPRVNPFILRISDDDAIIFSSIDNNCNLSDLSIIDRLKGKSYREPFLDTWYPLSSVINKRSYNHFIGNEDEGKYEWLVPVENTETHHVAIAHVKGIADNDSVPTFSLLPIDSPVPDSIYGKPVIYSSLVCDRQIKVAYLIGEIAESRIIVLVIPYDTQGSSPLTIYVTDSVPIHAQSVTPVLTPEGDLVFAGGHIYNNFSPTAAVIRLPLGQINHSFDSEATTLVDSKNYKYSFWIIFIFLIVTSSLAIWIDRRKKCKINTLKASEPVQAAAIEGPTQDKTMPKDETFTDIFNRIELLMTDEQLYLNPNLRASDVAARVGSNTAYVSAAINSQRGCSFTQYLTSYRITYAQELMRKNPESKISAISALSGFSTDSTFFRAFRSITGMTPKEWLADNQDK